jgi:hypothetical protein
MASIRRKSVPATMMRLPAPVRLWAAFQLGAGLAILFLLSPFIGEAARFTLALTYNGSPLDVFVRSISRFPLTAAGWVVEAETWLERLPFPAFPPIRFEADALFPAPAALLPLIAASFLLWLVGNALLIRGPRRNSGER